jgi:hypothetical protein
MKSLEPTLKTPRPLLPPWLAFLFVGVLSVISALGQTEKAKSADKAKGKEKAEPVVEPVPAAAPASEMKAFGNMIPMGSRSRGFVLPTFENGKPNTLITADAMTRVDESRLFAEKMVIRMYGDTTDQDVRIDLITGTYNIEQQALSSKERSRVSRADFQIEGDGMVFDTKTSQGKMVGNVEMVIHDLKALTKSASPPAADAKTGVTKPAAAIKPAAAEAPQKQ